MKKILLLSSLVGALYACSPKSDNPSANNVPSNAIGYIVENSDNIALSRRSAKYIETGDTAAYRATYSKDAIIHENMANETVDQNMANINALKAAGVTLKIDSGAIYWEDVYYTPKSGYTNFVHSYMVMTASKGSKEVKILMHAADAIKNGLQVEEWLTYDTHGITELLK